MKNFNEEVLSKCRKIVDSFNDYLMSHDRFIVAEARNRGYYIIVEEKQGPEIIMVIRTSEELENFLLENYLDDAMTWYFTEKPDDEFFMDEERSGFDFLEYLRVNDTDTYKRIIGQLLYMHET